MRNRAITKPFWIIFSAIGVLLVLYGLYAFTLPWLDVRHWDFMTTDPERVGYIRMNFRLMGLLSSGFGLFTLTVSGTAFRRGERWSWFTFWYIPVFLLLVMIFTWPGMLLSPVLVLTLAGLLLSYRQFFPKNA
jgi:hypothetical protein